MTENKDKDKDKDNEKEKDKDKEQERGIVTNIANTLGIPQRERTLSTYSTCSEDFLNVPTSAIYKTSCASIISEILTINLDSGEFNSPRQYAVKDETTVGTQRVYKKTSPNSILTLYLPTREIISFGTQPSILKGILFVDPKFIQGYRVYAQLTLTFRYGREDEEVMGLRFCNEAIMSLHQIWPRTSTTDDNTDSLTPLQDALIKRLGNGAHPFTLSLSPQSPPSVQLVPAKRYYGAPIGTSYDVRCFIADKTDDKFHRRATVKMGVRVIHRTDIFTASGPENFAALLNNPLSPPPIQDINNLQKQQQQQSSTSSLPITNTGDPTTSSIKTTTVSSIPPFRNTGILLGGGGGGGGGGVGGVSGSGKTVGCGGGGGLGGKIIGDNNLITTTTTTTTNNTTTTFTSTSSSTITNNTNITTNNTITTTTITSNIIDHIISNNQSSSNSHPQQQQQPTSLTSQLLKNKKSERVESFPKIRLSPKSFRFSGRFGRSKSEVERGPSDPFYNYSKSFQEVDKYDCTGGPQGSVDKPFLLQEGRVGLRASLNKSWYTHGEDVIVTVNIKNDSKKTVRRMRICAIQHVDVCMFNNGKFKNIVADTDNTQPNNNSSTSDQTSVGPGKSLSSTFILKPKRGPTKNWIALEDSLQRSSEPNEITGSIAASAIRIPSTSSVSSTQIGISPSTSIPSEDRNVFAIYVSYYVKVKLTLSGMGGELSLKLPFSLVHIESPISTTSIKLLSIDINESQQYKNKNKNDLELTTDSINKITLLDESSLKKQKLLNNDLIKDDTITICKISNGNNKSTNNINKIDSIEDEIQITITSCTTPGTSGEQVEIQADIETTATTNNSSSSNSNNSNCNNINRRKLVRSITVDKDLSDDDDDDNNVKDIGDQICDGKNNDIEKKINVNDNDKIEKCDNDNSQIMDDSKNLNEISQQIHQQTICAQVHSNTSTNL